MPAPALSCGRAFRMARAAQRIRLRLRQFADFGAGKAVGHWGGWNLWQLEGSADLLVAWRETPEGSPREAEIELLSRFRNAHGGRPPIANIAG